MHRINVLLAGADRRTGSAAEAIVLDVCYDQAVVHVFRTPRVDELIHFGCHEHVALIVVLADHLFTEPSRGGTAVANVEVRRAIATIRGRCATPILAITVTPENESALLEAGANYVAVGQLDSGRIKAELRTLLKLAELKESVATERWSLGAWLRGSLRLRNA